LQDYCNKNKTSKDQTMKFKLIAAIGMSTMLATSCTRQNQDEGPIGSSSNQENTAPGTATGPSTTEGTRAPTNQDPGSLDNTGSLDSTTTTETTTMMAGASCPDGYKQHHTAGTVDSPAEGNDSSMPNGAIVMVCIPNEASATTPDSDSESLSH